MKFIKRIWNIEIINLGGIVLGITSFQSLEEQKASDTTALPGNQFEGLGFESWPYSGSELSGRWLSATGPTRLDTQPPTQNKEIDHVNLITWAYYSTSLFH